jgi:hypothetical protein
MTHPSLQAKTPHSCIVILEAAKQTNKKWKDTINKPPIKSWVYGDMRVMSRTSAWAVRERQDNERVLVNIDRMGTEVWAIHADADEDKALV